MSTDRWEFAIDEEALNETRAYKEFLVQENRVEESLANATRGTEAYNRAKLASKIFEILRDMRWADHVSAEKPKIIRWAGK